MPLLPFILKLQKSWGGDYEASNDLMAGQGTAEREVASLWNVIGKTIGKD